MIDPHVVVFDFSNFVHRARSGFSLGEHAITFNFFRAFRAEVERHRPSRIIMVLDGSPTRQLTLDPEYKANRRVEETDPKKIDAYRSFLNQKSFILSLLKTRFPVSVMRQADHEADDLIYNIVERSTRAVPFTVISTDTDFIQLLELENVKVYDPVKKTYAEKPPYDYVTWKALRGDPTDNVPSVVGEKTALKYVGSYSPFEIQSKRRSPLIDEKVDRFNKNLDLIRFKKFSDLETLAVTSYHGERDWDDIKREFETCKFKSIVNDKSWKKFIDTFEPLWGNA